MGRIYGLYASELSSSLVRALVGAAECVTAIEEFCRSDENGLVGTVGYISAMPGATNVIPGQVAFTIDIRAPTDMHRRGAVADIVRRIEAIAKRRDLALQLDVAPTREAAIKELRDKSRSCASYPPLNAFR